MTKRMFWFVLGVVAGVTGSMYLQRRLQQVKERYTPPAIANRMTDAVKRFGSDVAESARAGKATMSERETDMRRTRRHHRAESPVNA